MKKIKILKKDSTCWIIIAIIVLLSIDLLTKYFFYDLNLLSDYFIAYLNRWISWSINLNYWIILTVTMLALVLFYNLKKYKLINNYMFILLIAWTLWNLYDRVVYEWVRDFIPFFDIFIFNIADFYLNVWVGYILLDEIISFVKKK